MVNLCCSIRRFDQSKLVPFGLIVVVAVVVVVVLVVVEKGQKHGGQVATIRNDKTKRCSFFVDLES